MRRPTERPGKKQGGACAGAKFDFISYMRESMEDDYGKLVGLGLPMWLFLIFFVLLSSVWGACTLYTPALLSGDALQRAHVTQPRSYPRSNSHLGSLQNGRWQAKLKAQAMAAHPSPGRLQLQLHALLHTAQPLTPHKGCIAITARHRACASAINMHAVV